MNLEFNDRAGTWREGAGSHQQTFFQRLCDRKNRKSLVLVTMLAVLLSVLLLVFLSSAQPNSAAQNQENETLQFVSLVFRHGARTPTGTYNSDPYKNYTWPGGWGELTNEGKMQMFNLGETFRRRYNGFLPADYSPNDIYVQSSSKSRTLMSAYSVLAGLYPPTAQQTWNPNLAWQPIPVYSIARTSDALLVAKKPCEYYNKHMASIQNSTEFVNLYKTYVGLFKNLTMYCNQTVHSLLAVELLHSHFSIQEAHGLALPYWAKFFYPEPLRYMSKLSMAFFTYDDVMKRLKGGPLLQDIVNNMSDKLNKTLVPDKKMMVYSAHDLTIVNLWRTLGFEELILPDFGATLAIELHKVQNSTESEVKLYYFNSSSTVEPHRLYISRCQDPCVLSEFTTVLDKYIPLDWDKECKADIS